MYNKARSEKKKSFEIRKRIWFGSDTNRKRRPHGWVKKQKGLKGGAVGTDVVAAAGSAPVSTSSTAAVPPVTPAAPAAQPF
jgi:hypothetical protein